VGTIHASAGGFGGNFLEGIWSAPPAGLPDDSHGDRSCGKSSRATGSAGSAEEGDQTGRERPEEGESARGLGFFFQPICFRCLSLVLHEFGLLLSSINPIRTVILNYN